MEDIIASVALIRPGPIKGNGGAVYRPPAGPRGTNLYPSGFRADLAKTYGVVLYQEQVIQIATEIAGFTPANLTGCGG